MQLYTQKDETITSLSVNQHFATLVEENESSFIFEIRCSILQSEIFKKSLSKLVINVINDNVLLKDNGQRALVNTSKDAFIVDKDKGQFEIENNIIFKNFSQILKAKQKKESIIESKSIDLQSYINPLAIKDFQSNKNVSEIQSLKKSVFDLEKSEQLLEYPSSNLLKSDIKKLNYQLISQFFIDPSEVAYDNNNNNAIIETLKKFYLFDALTSLDANNDYFQLVKKVKTVDSVYIKTYFELKKDLVTNNLKVEFELYKHGIKNPIQRKFSKIKILDHVKFFNIENLVPKVSALNGILTITQGSNLDSYVVKVKEINNVGVYTPYRDVYQAKSQIAREKKQQLHLNKTFTNKFIGGRKKQDFKQIEKAHSNKIIIYRCLFQNSLNEYLNPFFKNVIVTNRINVDTTTLLIEPSQDSKSAVLKITNVPYYAKQFQVLKRNISLDGIKSEFIVVNHFQDIKDLSTLFVDSYVVQDKMYEYFIRYKCADGTIKNSVYQTYKHISSVLLSSISTTILRSDVVKESNGKIKVDLSFLPNVSEDMGSKIRNILTYTENLGVFSGEVDNLADKFKNSIFYKISRVNLKTGVRETWENPDVATIANRDEILFSDSEETRMRNSISDIDPSVNYKYEFRVFFKDPQVLLRDYTQSIVSEEIGRTGKKRNYAYRPYKWRQPITLKTGMILAQDNFGNNITYSELNDGEIGVSATYFLGNQEKKSNIKSFSAERIDLNKVRVYWDVDEDIKEYDHFLLIKEVNKKREFLGAVFSLECIDLLKENKDIGIIKYYIIPIMNDYSPQLAAVSNSILIDPQEF